MQLVFFNGFQNGDLHFSRMFVKDIISKTGFSASYCHNKHPAILKDVCAHVTPADASFNLEAHQHVPYVHRVERDELWINTWICQDRGKYCAGRQCTLDGNYALFTSTLRSLEKAGVLPCVELNHADWYIPAVDYQLYNLQGVDVFLAKETRQKILVCNGHCTSGQCRNFDFDLHIEQLRKSERVFILTAPSKLRGDDIVYTHDITGCCPDLNEIGYLSTFCDILIGRSSGPFCFSVVQQNWLNPRYTAVCFDTLGFGDAFWCKPRCRHYWDTGRESTAIDTVLKEACNE